jgi:AraC-like DNA-binding protein
VAWTKVPWLVEPWLAKPVKDLAEGRSLMALSAPDYTVIRFTSSSLPEQTRGKAMEELRERGLLATRFAPCGQAPAHVELANRVMPGLRILTATYAGVRHEGVPAQSGQQGSDDLFLCMILGGTSLASRHAREITLSDGDAVLMTGEDAAWSFASPAAVNVAGLRLPRRALAPLVPNLDDAVMRKIPRDAAGLRLLRRYLELVADDDALAQPASRRLIVSHFYDLAALALGVQCDREALAERRTVRSVRLAAIKADIVANLHDGDLNPTMVATRNRMTVRYLHKLFQSDGITYSEFVLGQRLARAYRVLESPLQSHRAIATVAFELGFNDLSYFNRAFRRRYDATPSEVRIGTAARSQRVAD